MRTRGVWGLVPAAGVGSRIQPLACSKELLPIGARRDGAVERPVAVSEYVVDRMEAGGAERICLVLSPDKGDILGYYGRRRKGASLCYVVQPQPAGLCDALFTALPLIGDGEQVLVGLPDTIWFPRRGFLLLPDDRLSFLLFAVDAPQHFDAVVLGAGERVLEIQVKHPTPRSPWVWGAFKLTGGILRQLQRLWFERDRRDEYLGTLVNAYLAAGGEALGVCAGRRYLDVGTVGGYHRAVRLCGAGRARPAERADTDTDADAD